MPRLEEEFPLASGPSARCLMGASFGAVAALTTAYRYPELLKVFYGEKPTSRMLYVRTRWGV